MADRREGYLADLWSAWSQLQRWAGFWGPVTSLPRGLNPAVAIGAVLSLIITAGLAVGSLAALLTSLLLLYLLLSQVFGVRFEFSLP